MMSFMCGGVPKLYKEWKVQRWHILVLTSVVPFAKWIEMLLSACGVLDSIPGTANVFFSFP